MILIPVLPFIVNNKSLDIGLGKPVTSIDVATDAETPNISTSTTFPLLL